MMRILKEFVNGWVILGALLIGGLLWLMWAGVFLFLKPESQQSQLPTAIFVVIPAPTLTPTTPPDMQLTPTPPGSNYRSVEGLGVGVYVQISGTEGDGLRIRSGPGTDNPPIFLGMDEEVFEIKDGPQEADGFIWWYLAAPYDEARSGWAASKYLAVISEAP